MISASSQVVITLERRHFLEASLAGLMLPLAARAAAARPAGSAVQAGHEAQSDSVVFDHDLPNVTMDGWQVTVVEVVTPPGPGSHRHQHPGFVLGYVLEGDLRFQVDGQPERTIPAGRMFYEAPGGVHAVSASASPTKSVRFLGHDSRPQRGAAHHPRLGGRFGVWTPAPPNPGPFLSRCLKIANSRLEGRIKLHGNNSFERPRIVFNARELCEKSSMSTWTLSMLPSSSAMSRDCAASQ